MNSNSESCKKSCCPIKRALFIAGILSIIGSLYIWFAAPQGGTPEANAHMERMALFVGLWAPTLFILAKGKHTGCLCPCCKGSATNESCCETKPMTPAAPKVS